MAPKKRARTISEAKFISVLEEFLPKAIEEGTVELTRSLRMTDKSVGGLERLYERIQEDVQMHRKMIEDLAMGPALSMAPPTLAPMPDDLREKLGLNPVEPLTEETQYRIRDDSPEVEPDDPWAHRSIGMRCRSCMWFVEKAGPQQPGNVKGRCRKSHPTMNGYPVVFETDWCGSHKLA